MQKKCKINKTKYKMSGKKEAEYQRQIRRWYPKISEEQKQEFKQKQKYVNKHLSLKKK